MRRWRETVCVLLAMLALPFLAASAEARPDERQVRAHLSGIGVPFIANEGQVDERVAYYAPTFAGTVFVTRKGEVVYGLSGRPLTETFRGGRVTPAGQEPGVTTVSTFRGNDPTRWRSDLPTFGEVGLGEVWPGVSVALKARGRNVEKIFTVAPGARVDRIRMRVDGAQALRLGPDGALVARAGRGDVTFTPPVAFQERDGVRTTVPVAYRVRRGEYRFTVGAYDRTRPLVIDPLLQSTYLGGSGSEDPNSRVSVAFHPASQDVYVAGTTSSTDFPFGASPGALSPQPPSATDVFVARLNRELTVLKRVAFLGGTGATNTGDALAIHSISSLIYVAGTTSSTDFPGAGFNGGNTDAFVTCLREDLGAVEASILIGGTGDESATALGIQAGVDAVFVGGFTTSGALLPAPGATGGFQTANAGGRDGFVALLTGDLTLTTATFLGGAGIDSVDALAVRVSPIEVYVAGVTTSSPFPGLTGVQTTFGGGTQDGFVTRLNAGLTTATSTYVGGSGTDNVAAIGLVSFLGRVYVAGTTTSPTLPGTPSGIQNAPGGAEDAFVAYLNDPLTSMTYTFLGGSGSDFGLALNVDSTRVYVAGATLSPDFPGLHSIAVQPALAVGNAPAPDAFVANLDLNLTGGFDSTYLGGKGFDAATSLSFDFINKILYVAGNTTADTSPSNFPGVAGGARPDRTSDGTDVFVSRLTNLVATPPDFAIVKTHSGDFARGQRGATYLITVTNLGGFFDLGQVEVTENLPAGLTLVGMSGAGWSCVTAPTPSCTRSDALPTGASYPTITVTVNVAANAIGVVNSATVSHAFDSNPVNNTTFDPTNVLNAPDLTIGKFHVGRFGPGQVGKTYTITVGNVGTAFTTGTVTVVDTLPGGLTATAIGGDGWSCALDTMTCTRADALPPAASYPPITVIVDVSASPPPTVTNTATVSGGGDINPTNNTASDLTLAAQHFEDVPGTDPFFPAIEALVAAGITGGCSADPPLFCPGDAVTRAQIAVFLVRAVHGGGFVPSLPTGIFADVPNPGPFTAFIEQLFNDDVTDGCATDPLRYCPDTVVSRAQIAAFILRAVHGTGFVPPPAVGLFTDVPVDHPLAAWIEALFNAHITSGCGPSTFCPDAIVTRAQIAVLLVRAFGLPG